MGAAFARRVGVAALACAAVIGGTAQAQNEGKDPIRVGVLVAQSPPGSVIQGEQVLDGLHIAQEMINSSGGVLGRSIELLVEDAAGLPEQGRSGAERLITQSDVIALTGEHQSSVCLAEIEVAHKYHVPYVNTNCWADAIREKGYEEVFNPGPWNSLVSKAMAETIAAMDVEDIVAFAENTDYGIGQARILGQMLEKMAPEVSYEYRVIDRKARDFTAALLPMRRNPPDMVVTIVLPPAGYLLLSQLHAQGIAPTAETWLFDGAGISDYPDFWNNVSEAGKYLIALGFYHPEMKLTKMGEAVRDTYVEMTGKAPGRLIFQAADSLFTLAGAIRKAGSTEADAMIKTMAEGKFDGTRGSIEFYGEPGPTYHQWLDVPYVIYQYTEVNQDVADTILVRGPGSPLNVELLQKPQS